MAKTRATIIGCGDTGIRIGLALRLGLPDAEFVGHDKDRDATRKAAERHAIDREDWNLPRSVERAALIVLAIPADQIEPTLKAIARDVMSGAMIVALGGAHVANVAAARRHLPEDVSFASSEIIQHPDRVALPGEPAAAVHLKDAMWSIAATGHEEQINALASIITEIGARPLFVDPAEHDGLLLSVNALPDVLGSLLMLTVSGDPAWRERGWAAGATFNAMTHGAERAPADVQNLLGQRDAARYWLNEYLRQAVRLRDALDANDAAALEVMLSDARDRRAAWLAMWRKGREDGSTPVPKTGRSVLGMLISDRLADRLRKPGEGKP
jgi:prephenate dehydrogenase